MPNQHPDFQPKVEIPQVKKVALAFSGGLDSTLAITLLKEYYGAEEVLAVTVNVGLTDREIEDCRSKAELLGVPWELMEATDEFADEWIARAIRANANYEGYPVATSMTRQLIARNVAEWAVAQGCDAICEGSTGKGNDQYRMANVFAIFAPDLEVIVPVREFDFTREQEKQLCEYYNIPYKAGIGDDLTMWCRSIGSGEVDNLQMRIPEDEYVWYQFPESAPDEPQEVTIEFEGGIPVKCDDVTGLANIIQYLNDVAGKHAIGKIDMFEDGMIGLKSREVYEAPAATVILKVHRDLEQLCLTKEQVQNKPNIERLWAYQVYHGAWFHPFTEDCAAFIESSQAVVTGKYTLSLYKGNIDIIGRESDSGLFDPEIRSLATTSFQQPDSGPATKIHALQYKILSKRGLPFLED
ncbi:MAG: argininosuccinate synthase [candidate division WS1 bacterium]|jgi:argininosuccinate synthase|nr:argininosuccinate synthase [candidate division WS1 bacterium]